MKHASDYKRVPSEASVFHGLACSFLTDLGFTLVNDPSQFLSHFNASVAVYRSPRGLFLSTGFEPGDSNTGQLHCGRQWCVQGRPEFISNYYSELAKRFALDVPMDYKLGYGEEKQATMQTMLADLKRTLPIIVPRVTLDDLLHIERDQKGAETWARARFGPEYLKHIEIAAFRPR